MPIANANPGGLGKPARPAAAEPAVTKRKISGKRGLIILMILLIGGIAAAQVAGFINLKPTLAKVPVVGKYFKIEQPAAPTDVPAADPESETAALQIKIKEQDDLLKGLLDEKETLQQDKQKLADQVQELQTQLQGEQTRRLGFKDMARYYGQMKPATAAAIIDKQDDQTVIGILQELPEDQAARILAALKPERAAALVNQMIK